MTACYLLDPSGSSHKVAGGTIHEPISGVWFARVKLLTEGHGVTGRCVLRVGGVEWHGTVSPEFSGEWGGSGTVGLVGGANGWAQRVVAKGYHSDSGVKGRVVARDVAVACGETLASFDGASSMGVDYARPSGFASTTLEDCCGAAQWWVGRDGLTRVGSRDSSSVKMVLDYDPANKTLVAECEDLSLVAPGFVVSDDRIGGLRTIRDLEVRISSDRIRAVLWCGGQDDGAGRLPRLLRALVARLTDGPLWGAYRYRVVSMASDGRVNLQAVRSQAGVPDLMPVAMWPGVAGSHSDLKEGTVVHVEFEEGDRGRPFISRFAPRTDGAFAPESVSFGNGTRASAGVGDQVTIFMTPGTPVAVTGTMGVPPATTPFVGTAVFSSPLRGVVSSGTPKVKLPT